MLNTSLAIGRTSRTGRCTCPPWLAHVRVRTRQFGTAGRLSGQELARISHSHTPTTSSLRAGSSLSFSVMTSTSTTNHGGESSRKRTYSTSPAIYNASLSTSTNAMRDMPIRRRPVGLVPRPLSTPSSSVYRSSTRRATISSRTDLRRPVLDNSNTWVNTGSVLHALGTRGFRTTPRRELAGASMAFGAMALLKSSTAIACIAAISRLLLTLLPFAAMKTIRTKLNRKWHAAHFVRLQTPPHIAEFYERELSEEVPVEPDCRSWKEIDSPAIIRVRDQCPWWSFGRLVKSKTTLKMGSWPPWGQESLKTTGPTNKFGQELTTYEFKSVATRAEIYNEVIAWTINLSRERTGLGKTSETIDAGHKPWKRWTMFYLPQPSAGAMRQIEEMSIPEREKLYELRRWFAKEKVFGRHVQRGKWFIWTLIWLPIVMFVVVAAFSLERVPFTGRFRLIMLSPEEEEGLTDKLRGPGWYRTVLSMFTTAESPAPPVVPMADWRWNWVNGVLRRLERGLEEHCRAEREGRDIAEAFSDIGPKWARDLLPPPPPDHPLHPRSRGSAVLHGALEGKEADHHIAVGPPYALLLLDNEERNAMSYGFGEGGSGGVVVYTGILDEILSSAQDEQEAKQRELRQNAIPVAKPAASIWESFFGRSSSGSHPPNPSVNNVSTSYTPEPTEEQTLQLALVLAHELSHLVLSHHLESLSWSEIVIPGATGLGSDLIRTILYPITFFLGPFANDAISQITKKKAEETTAYSDIHFSVKQEREADVVSLRLLAYAGFDPKAAVKYWSDVPQPACTNTKSAIEHLPFQFLRGTVHDEKQQRLQRLLDELERWRRYAAAKKQDE